MLSGLARNTIRSHQQRSHTLSLWQLTCQPPLLLLSRCVLTKSFYQTDTLMDDPSSGSPLEKAWRGIAMPPEEKQLGARVEHIMVDKPGMVSQLVAEALDLPQVCASEGRG